MATVTLSPQNKVPLILSQRETALNIHLTQAARDMIAVPIEEMIVAKTPFDWDDVTESIDKLLEMMRKDPAPQAHDDRGALTASAVVYALHMKFCDIPPFCAPRPAQLRNP
ncbi:hypothetical protein HFN68_32590 [Rhizobium laguerreae]|uniref:hypothetical protein n=1 Tax=Rhizobium laguerreae TaxID=1076926 RepID=UPI001C90E284|nr:hypothetical protein [Rhizobium laguerreae]MBY3537584.1 hypothetical protein [Rhizobium laguerreae]